MKTITLVTGNPNKLKELKAIAPAGLALASKEIDLPEIQSLDLRKIVEAKVKAAYEIVQGPVIIEDVSAGLDDFGGLPGPFYKFFREKLGDIILVKLASIAGSNKVTVQCLAAYYDGEILLTGHGVIHGVVVEPRGQNGFGFDPVIRPDGQSRTMAEMSAEEKNTISHRGRAFRDLIKQLEALELQ
jgi:inosine triphosphate pyrophosphatase